MILNEKEGVENEEYLLEVGWEEKRISCSTFHIILTLPETFLNSLQLHYFNTFFRSLHSSYDSTRHWFIPSLFHIPRVMREWIRWWWSILLFLIPFFVVFIPITLSLFHMGMCAKRIRKFKNLTQYESNIPEKFLARLLSYVSSNSRLHYLQVLSVWFDFFLPSAINIQTKYDSNCFQRLTNSLLRTCSRVKLSFNSLLITFE